MVDQWEVFFCFSEQLKGPMIDSTPTPNRMQNQMVGGRFESWVREAELLLDQPTFGNVLMLYNFGSWYNHQLGQILAGRIKHVQDQLLGWYITPWLVTGVVQLPASATTPGYNMLWWIWWWLISCCLSFVDINLPVAARTRQHQAAVTRPRNCCIWRSWEYQVCIKRQAHVRKYRTSQKVIHDPWKSSIRSSHEHGKCWRRL